MPDQTIFVICEDGVQRHPEPFTSRSDAKQFAEWGHLCTNSHHFATNQEQVEYLAYTLGRCEVCGEHYDLASLLPSKSEVGEFVDTTGDHRMAHAQCGLDAEWELA